jgi:hypothetical protein
MSLFGKLIKNVVSEAGKAVSDGVGKTVSDQVGKAVSDSVGKAVTAAKEAGIDLGEVKSALEEAKKNVEAAAGSAAGGVDMNAYFEEELPEDSEDVRDKLLKVLAEEFPACEVRENVSPLTIGAWGKPMNYSMGVYKDGAPALFIMFCGKNTTRLRAYRWAKEAAAKAGVPMINFVRDWPNRYWYLKERLHKYL